MPADVKNLPEISQFRSGPFRRPDVEEVEEEGEFWSFG